MQDLPEVNDTGFMERYIVDRVLGDIPLGRSCVGLCDYDCYAVALAIHYCSVDAVYGC